MSRFLFIIYIGRSYFNFYLIAVLTVIMSLPPLSFAKEEAAVVISEIVIEPRDALSLDELKSLVDIKEGAAYSRKVLKKGIKLLYLKGGFSDISVDADNVNGKVRLSFKFKLKERVGEVSFSGNEKMSRRRLVDILTISEFDELNQKVVEKQAAVIKEFYRKKGYFECEVGFRLIERPSARNVDVEFIIHEGNRASIPRIVFNGNKALSSQQLFKILSLKSGELYDEGRVTNAVKRSEDFYRKNGYPEARASWRYDYISGSNEAHISVNIDEGERNAKEPGILGINFKGNAAISSKTLRKQMLTGKLFSDEIFAADMEAIEFLYRKSGYLSARVAEKAITYSKDGTHIGIEITISEGPQTIIKGMEIDGNYLFTGDEMFRETGLKMGLPFDPWAVEDGVLKMLSLYSQRGYIYTKISYKEEYTEDRSGVVIKYYVDEGIPVRIGRIVIRGNDFTEDKVIRRELRIKPGDVYNPEMVFKSQQRVYRLGYLSNVRLTPIEEEVAEEHKDLLLSVKERKAGAFEFGAGYGTEEKFRGFAELSHKNLFGTGAGARLRGDVSQLENSYLLGFKKPWLFDYPVNGNFSLVDKEIRRPSYSLEKYAAIAGLDKDLIEFVKVSLQYEYEISRLFNVDPGAKIAPEDEGTRRIGTVTPLIIRDSRDNPFNPRTGSVNSFKLDYSAGVATGSEAEFVRYLFQSSWYLPLSKAIVGGLSARGGWAEAYGNTKEIPISKRFFLGGRTTVRGFPLDSIGPKGADGSPKGGDVYLNLNSEVRFPIYASFGGLLFLDAGNVWLKGLEAVNILELRSSAGAGLRYVTPIGPLSLDAGWKLDQKPGESAWEWHFTIGNVF